MSDDLEETLNASYQYCPLEEKSLGARIFGIYEHGPDAGRSKASGCMGYLIGFGASAAALLYAGISKYYGAATQLNEALVALGFIGITAFSGLGISRALDDGSKEDSETAQR